MNKTTKRYIVILDLKIIEMIVFAKSETEAKRKAKKRLALKARKPGSIIDEIDLFTIDNEHNRLT